MSICFRIGSVFSVFEGWAEAPLAHSGGVVGQSHHALKPPRANVCPNFRAVYIFCISAYSCVVVRHPPGQHAKKKVFSRGVSCPFWEHVLRGWHPSVSSSTLELWMTTGIVPKEIGHTLLGLKRHVPGDCETLGVTQYSWHTRFAEGRYWALDGALSETGFVLHATTLFRSRGYFGGFRKIGRPPPLRTLKQSQRAPKPPRANVFPFRSDLSRHVHGKKTSPMSK